MNNLFTGRRIRDTVSDFRVENFDELFAIVKGYYDEEWVNGDLEHRKEELEEQNYNSLIFGKVLGYEFGKTMRPKETGASGVPDLVLGDFRDGRVVSAVVELKDAKTSLDKPQQRERNESPVDQGFRYKNGEKHCPFVIVSNFYEIRLYHNYKGEYESWILKELIDPKDDCYTFKKFYFLLNSKNVLSKSEKEKSITERLLDDIREEEIEISKKFYKEYKQARLELLRDIYAKNNWTRRDPDLLVEKAQKIVDRIVFACFCEDKNLLPSNIIDDFLEKSKGGYSELWHDLKGFFQGIDKGNPKLELAEGYNGGLFREDEALSKLEVSNKPLQKLLELSRYDFDEELSVNILGHIFEQSISDLEEVKQKVKKLQEEVDEKISKRKKDGIFYTPDYIVNYIVENSLGEYLHEREEEIKEKYGLKENIQEQNYRKREKQVYQEYQNVLRDIKVLDPACGSGAFLVKVFDFLLTEHRRVGKILNDIFDNDQLHKQILQNNIYGVDLNQESVEITKLSLWLKTAQKDKKLADLDDNIKCGNSLIDDSAIARDKAFKWDEEFPEIIKGGGFGVIVGNPPYVKEFVSRESFEAIKNSNSLLKEFYEGKMDLWYFFAELGSFILKEGGKLSYIAPNNWVTNSGAKKMRNNLLESFRIEKFIDFNDYKVFEEAGIQTMVFVLERKHEPGKSFVKYKKVSNEKSENEVISFLSNRENFESMEFDNRKFIDKNIVFGSSDVLHILEKIESQKDFELRDNEVAQGIVGAPDKAFIIGAEELKNFNNKEKEFLKKFYTNANGQSDKYIFYIHSGNFDGKEIYSFENIKNFFEKNEDILKKAKIKYKTPNKSYFYLHRERDKAFFEIGPKLISQTRTEKTKFLYTESEYYCSRALNVIKTGRINLKYLYCIYNSKLSNFWLRNKGKQIGHLLQVDKKPLIEIPIKNVSAQGQVPFVELADRKIGLNKELYERIASFLDLLKSDFKLEGISKKLQKFYELSSDGFLKELKTDNLSLKDKWLSYFNEKKPEIIKLEEELDKTEAEIDEMVYVLYGLSDEEVGFVNTYEDK